MFKVEHLIIIDEKEISCTSIPALKNLIQSNNNLKIDKKKLKFKTYEIEFTVQSGKIEDKKHTFFHLKYKCEKEEDIEKFTELLREVKRTLSLITKDIYNLWDDISLYYSQQAYPILNGIENLMRKLISKFMLTNVGLGWMKQRVPTDVEKSINKNNKDINYLQNVDFIQLKNFLFSENFPNQKEGLINRLKKAEDFSDLNLEDIKTLLPTSNWERYFEDLVECEADFLKKRWDILYDLRNKVAHNKLFSKADLDKVKKNVSEVNPPIIKAIELLDEINISSEERETVAENIAINLNTNLGEFMISWRDLEHTAYKIVAELLEIEDNQMTRVPTYLFRHLRENEVISADQYKKLTVLRQTRNRLLHDADYDMQIEKLEIKKAILNNAVKFLQEYYEDNKK